MRVLKLSALAVLLLWVIPSAAGAQEKKDQDKKPEWPTEVGGKNLDEWIAALGEADRSHCVRALKTLPLFGPKASVRAVPDILAEVQRLQATAGGDTSFRANAPAVLGAIMSGQENPDEKLTKEVMKTLKPLLRDPQIVIRYRAVMAVTLFGPHVKEVKKELVLNATDRETHEIREAAIKALAAYPFDRHKEVPPQDIQDVLLGRPAQPGRPEDLGRLGDTSASVRLAALHTIETLNLPDLDETKSRVNVAINRMLEGTPLKGFKDRENQPQVRIAAHLVAYGIDKTSNAKRCVDIAFYISKKDPAVRVEAINALKIIGHEAQDQTKVLLPCLKKDQDPAVRLAAFQALATIGGTDKQAAVVFAYTKEEEPLVRLAALQAMGAFGKAAKKHIPGIVEFVIKEKEELPVKIAAVQALGNIGPDAKGREILLLPLIDGKQETPMRIAAIYAVAHINPKASAVWNKLLDCLNDQDSNVVGATGNAFARMGKDAEKAVYPLKRAAERKNLPPALRAQLLDIAAYIDREVNPPKKDKKK